MINELVDYAYRGAFAEVPAESPDVMPLLRRRAAVSRSWLLLPVLWKARLGTLSAGWRDELPRPEGPLAWDAAGAVNELRRMPIEPWEPGPVVGGEDPARVWFFGDVGGRGRCVRACRGGVRVPVGESSRSGGAAAGVRHVAVVAPGRRGGGRSGVRVSRWAVHAQ